MIRAASHVLMIEPVRFRFNPETAASNPFQRQVPPNPDEAVALAEAASAQHRVFRDLLVGNGVCVTVCRSLPTTPDAPFCNNWFSTHPPHDGHPATLVLYPLLSAARQRERRADIVTLLRGRYPRALDYSPREAEACYLESTGSLCLDHANGVAYAALSPRTDRHLAEEWARELGYRLVAFTATDPTGQPYYHTNVLMFLGHGIAGIVLEAIDDPGERRTVEQSLTAGGWSLLPLTQAQAAAYCGNCLALVNDAGEALLAMSTTAHQAFTPAQREQLQDTARLVHSELSAFEQLAGGSARCLLAELF